MADILKRIILGVFLLSSCYCPLNAFAGECAKAAGYFTLACRGPLSHRIRNETRLSDDRTYYIERVTVRWRFHRNSEAAGPKGRTLEPGTCAWEDRPVADSEPDSFFTGLGQFNPSYPLTGRLFINESISRCNNHPECVFILCATNKGEFLDTIPDEVDIKFPFNSVGGSP
jgi:hypothetical protein